MAGVSGVLYGVRLRLRPASKGCLPRVGGSTGHEPRFPRSVDPSSSLRGHLGRWVHLHLHLHRPGSAARARTPPRGGSPSNPDGAGSVSGRTPFLKGSLEHVGPCEPPWIACLQTWSAHLPPQSVTLRPTYPPQSVTRRLAATSQAGCASRRAREGSGTSGKPSAHSQPSPRAPPRARPRCSQLHP